MSIIFKIFFVILGVFAHGYSFGLDKLPGSCIGQPLDGFSEASYKQGVDNLFEKFEKSKNIPMGPGPKGKVGIKTYTYSGPGLSTPIGLLKAVIEALEKRGFSKKDIIIVDYSADKLRKSKILPSLSARDDTFYGVKVYALDTDLYWDKKWFYESNLPDIESWTYDSFMYKVRSVFAFGEQGKSYLNVLLLCDVDFWINLPMLTNNNNLQISCALANATLLNISQHKRFLKSSVMGPIAMAELALVPELKQTLLFSILTLERYQWLGEYTFNAYYTKSQPWLILGEKPEELDQWALHLLKRDNL